MVMVCVQLQALKPFKILQLDTCDEASCVRVAHELQGVPIDLLVNNAGIGRYGALDDATKQELMDCFEVNTVGPFLVAQALLPNLRLSTQTNVSAIIAQVSSQLGSITDNVSAGYYGYRASKAALNMVNASLAVDLKPDKIIAVAFHPGFVATDMNGHTGVIQAHESVEGMSRVIAGLTLQESGRFYSNEGELLRW